MRGRLDQLELVRTGSLAAQIEAVKEAAQCSRMASEQLIQTLRVENERLRQQIHHQQQQQQQKPSSRRDSGISVLSAEETPQGRELTFYSFIDRLVALYQQLCGVNISAKSENDWDCQMDGRHGHFAFSLQLTPTDEDSPFYTYRPAPSACHTEVWAQLPMYLREEIEFDVDQLQSFFWRLLDFLMAPRQQ